jgi:hypothetical protein
LENAWDPTVAERKEGGIVNMVGAWLSLTIVQGSDLAQEEELCEERRKI